MTISNFLLVIEKGVSKELHSLPSKNREKIASEVGQLQSNPFPQDYKKLKGTKSIYRIRIGKYRATYHVNKKTKTITVIKIAHRKDVYKP